MISRTTLHPLPGMLLFTALLSGCAPGLPEIAAPQPRVMERGTELHTVPLGEPLPLAEREAIDRAAALAAVEGEATYYASRFDGRRTASGEIFRNDLPWAAHPSWPFGTRVRVTNLRNARAVEVIIMDRGPHGEVARRRNTIIDLSQSAARSLDFIRAGRTPVLVEVLEWGDG